MGMRLVGLGPYQDGLLANHRLYYPIYAKCCELGMAVVVHTSFNFGRGLRLDTGRPLHLDDVATDFPNLVIVASHGGWPWVPEMAAVAWRHENVYIEVSGHRNKYMVGPGSAWESLFYYGNGPLKEKIVWGSIWPYLDMERQVEEARQLPFKAEVQKLLFFDNAQRILKRCGAIR